MITIFNNCNMILCSTQRNLGWEERDVDLWENSYRMRRGLSFEG